MQIVHKACSVSRGLELRLCQDAQAVGVLVMIIAMIHHMILQGVSMGALHCMANHVP